jgi:small subunit ribosomal protein S17e
VDRIKRISYEVLDKYKSRFGEDFADNKKVLDEVSIVRSKSLKNKITGYITRYIKKEIREEKSKKEQITSTQSEESVEKEVQAGIRKLDTNEKISEEEELKLYLATDEEIDKPIARMEEKTETIEEKTETIEEKTETIEEKTETIEEKTETIEEKTD